MDKFISDTKAYKAANAVEQVNMKKEAFEKWMGYLYIKNSDQQKYGSILQGLTGQYSMGHDRFPKTVTAATDILSNHRFDKKVKSD